MALGHDGPSASFLSRQNLPVLAQSDAEATTHGAYVLVASR